MAEEHNVFRRWVRLKQAAKERLDKEPVPADGEQAATPAAVDDAEDGPFDLSNLPSIESIAANTDIAAFLRADVPAELARAALRRAWTSDPAIRDFIGIAENQWDFNDPNAIPGFGPLDPVENPGQLLTQVSRRLEKLPDVLADVVPSLDTVPPVAGVSGESGSDQPIATTELRLADGYAQSEEAQDGVTPQHEKLGDEARNLVQKRRHGSALPR